MGNTSHNPDGSSGLTLEAEPVLQETFNIDDIERDERLQARAQLDQETIDSYAEEMQREVQFPPIELFQDDTHYYLADGWHRFEAARSINAQHIRANVRQGTRHDAILYAARANIKHGLRRSNADKRQAVTLLLHDEECCRWSDRKLAEHAGVDHKTVESVRKKLEASGEIPQIAKRIVERSGQSFTMATTKASKKPEISQEASASDQENMSQESNTQTVEDDASAETLDHPEVQDETAPALQDTPADQQGEISDRIQRSSASDILSVREADAAQADSLVPTDLRQRLVEVIQEYVQQHPDIAEVVVQKTVEDAMGAIHAWMTQPRTTESTTNA